MSRYSIDLKVYQRHGPSFTPSTPAAIEISRLVYSHLTTENPSLYGLLLPQYLDYYTTACIWMRMIAIKQKNSQPLDEAEEHVLRVSKGLFCVPGPIMLQLKQLGNVQPLTQQHLEASFPTLPQKQIGGRGGFYGVLQPPGPGIDDSLHNLYEEIPCLGVLSEAIMHAISDEEPGPYLSVVTYEGQQPNQNLLGFRRLGHRNREAKQLAFSSSITADDFPDNPANTAMNFELLMSISSVLEETRAFKVFKNVNFSELSAVGSTSLMIISRPLDFEGRTNLMSTIRPTSVSKELDKFFGEAVFFCSQLMKDSGPKADHSLWCMISPTAALPIPSQWIDNRNQRRNLPIQYMQEVFDSISCGASDYRYDIVRQLVLQSKR